MAKRIVIILFIASIVSVFAYGYTAMLGIVNDFFDMGILYTIISIPLSLFFIYHETVRAKKRYIKIIIFCLSCIAIVIFCFAFIFAFFMFIVITGIYKG